MTRFRVVLLTALALLAVSAVASSSSSASAFNRWWDVCGEGGGSGTKYPTHKCNLNEAGSGKWEWVVRGHLRSV